jgi:hypothetical protein
VSRLLRIAVTGALAMAALCVPVATFPAGALTGVHYTYSPTSGPVGTVIHFTATGCPSQSGSEDGLFTFETNPANPSGEQWSSIFKSGVPGQLTVPSFVAAAHYKIQAQCVANTFQPTYSPCGFTVTTTPGTAGACDSTTGATGNNPSVAIGDAAVVEGTAGQRLVRFTVSASKATAAAASVTYSTHPGTAQAGTDFVAKSGTATIATGATDTVVTVAIPGDTTTEPDETFTVGLASPTNATITRATGTGTILNDDPPAGVRIAIGNNSVVEGNSGARYLRFTVSLSKALTTAVSVAFATHSGTAVAGSDFVAKSGRVGISAGATSVVVAVAVTGDVAVEANQTLTVTLASPSGVALGRSTATGTILNDD